MGRVREPGERQKAKSERTHAVVVRAVIHCLDRYGYAETSISRVLERAGVSRGALQHHFPAKEDLITATATSLMERSLEQMTAPRARRRRGLRHELRELWTTLIHTREYRALLEILNAMRTDAALRERLLPILGHWNDAIDQQMILSYASTDGSDTDVIEIMRMSRCLLRGLVIQESFDRDSAAAESTIERWIDLIAPLLEPRSRANG